MMLSGHAPYMIELLLYRSQTVMAGYGGLIVGGQASLSMSPRIPRSGWMNVALPFSTVPAFGTLFAIAIPDLLKMFGAGFEWFVVNIRLQPPFDLRRIQWHDAHASGGVVWHERLCRWLRSMCSSSSQGRRASLGWCAALGACDHDLLVRFDSD